MYIHRLIEEKVLASLKNRKILFLLGARQVGKTTLIQELLKERRGVIYNMDIAVDRARLEAAAQMAPKEAFRYLEAPSTLVIDEAQRYPELGRIVKGWYDAHMQAKILLLGSSSINLLDTTAEALTGRNEKLWLTPLLFEEVLRQQSWYTGSLAPKRLQESFGKQIQALLLPAMVFGGYPEAFLTHDKETYLLNLAADYLLKDILQSTQVRSPETVHRLLLLLAHQIGSEVSISELATQLGISRLTVEHYLDLLERTFVIFRLTAFSTNPRKEIVKSKKIYFWDTGVKNALQKEFTLSIYRSDIGALWENWIIAEQLKRDMTLGLHQDFYFWRTRDGSEVDLVVKKGRRLAAFQIQWSPGKSSSGESFRRAHGIRPALIHRENFLPFLVSS